MKHCLLSLCCCAVLIACGEEKPSQTASAAAIASAPNSQIASAVLNVQQEADILQSSKQAMENISASDIAAIEQNANPIEPMQVDTLSRASGISISVTLPESCNRYFQRAQSCYQTQEQAEGLLNLLQDQRADLAQDTPDEAACQKLAQSFDAVANQLGCP